jgi:hypothetical protein
MGSASSCSASSPRALRGHRSSSWTMARRTGRGRCLPVRRARRVYLPGEPRPPPPPRTAASAWSSAPAGRNCRPGLARVGRGQTLRHLLHHDQRVGPEAAEARALRRSLQSFEDWDFEVRMLRRCRVLVVPRAMASQKVRRTARASTPPSRAAGLYLSPAVSAVSRSATARPRTPALRLVPGSQPPGQAAARRPFRRR